MDTDYLFCAKYTIIGVTLTRTLLSFTRPFLVSFTLLYWTFIAHRLISLYTQQSHDVIVNKLEFGSCDNTSKIWGGGGGGGGGFSSVIIIAVVRL